MLTGIPMSVVLKGNTAIIGYSIDAADIFDLSNPASPVFLGSIVSVGGDLFLYNGELFSTGAVPGNSNSPLGGVHIAQLSYVPFTLTAINFTGDCTVLKPPAESQAGAGCFNIYNDTVGGNLAIGDTIGTKPLSQNPAWQPSAGRPVGYVRGQTIKLQVTMTQNPVPIVPSTLTITGKGGPGLGDCVWTGQWPLTPTFTFTCTMTTAKAMAYNAINWTYTSGGAPVFIGITSLPIYVTLNSPLQYTNSNYTDSSPFVFHTTLGLALSGTESTDPVSGFNNTWNQFSTGGTGPANIQTWQGRKLYYYRNDPDGIPNTTIIGFNGCATKEETLLLNASTNGASPGHNSGQCGSFARLLIGALAVNGIHSAFADVEPSSSIGAVPTFLVKNWTAPTSNPSGPWQLCLNPEAAIDYMVPAQPGNVYCDLTSLNTLPGQNTQPPSEKIFNSHFIVKPLGLSGVPIYVDPSYGATYANAADFEQKAVFGYFDLQHPVGVTTTNSPIYSVKPPVPGSPQITITP